MKDRAMQALYALALDPIAETTADPNSYGFRRSRSTADAIEKCFTVLSRRKSAKWVLEADIKSCFDRINHDWLLANVPLNKHILKKWLKAGFVSNDIYHSTDEGTPQGGIISPILANLALDGLEKKLRERFPMREHYQKHKVYLVRYADDFIITGESKEILENEVKQIVTDFLKERGLELSEEKTRITHIDEGFDFLGQNVRMYNDKLLIKPSKANVKTFLDKVRTIIKSNKQTKPANLIMQLNPLIRGWANYHRHVVSKETYSKIRCEIFKTLWQWAKRRHLQKSRAWIKRKYFGQSGWVFQGDIEIKGETQTVHLLQMTSVPIVRHVKVKADANPYDPDWKPYFKRRTEIKMAENLSGKKQLLYLWKKQKGLCPICKQAITELTGWNNHHVIWKSLGGSNRIDNKVLLHPTCHKQVHKHLVKVVKPGPAKGLKKA